MANQNVEYEREIRKKRGKEHEEKRGEEHEKELGKNEKRNLGRKCLDRFYCFVIEYKCSILVLNRMVKIINRRGCGGIGRRARLRI